MRYNLSVLPPHFHVSFNTPINADAIQYPSPLIATEYRFNTPINADAIQLIKFIISP